MLTLNFDTWFVRKFLGYNSRYATPPNTICELGRVILGMSFLWLVCSIVTLAVVSLYLTGLFGVFYVMFTDATLAEFLNFGVKEATWTGFAWLVFLLGNIILLIAGIIFGIEFFKGVWVRFHDKTCTMIQWENDPATLRQREYEQELRELEESRAKLIADSENNA